MALLINVLLPLQQISIYIYVSWMNHQIKQNKTKLIIFIHVRKREKITSKSVEPFRLQLGYSRRVFAH